MPERRPEDAADGGNRRDDADAGRGTNPNAIGQITGGVKRLVAGADRYQRRHKWAAFPFAVV